MPSDDTRPFMTPGRKRAGKKLWDAGYDFLFDPDNPNPNEENRERRTPNEPPKREAEPVSPLSPNLAAGKREKEKGVVSEGDVVT